MQFPKRVMLPAAVALSVSMAAATAVAPIAPAQAALVPTDRVSEGQQQGSSAHERLQNLLDRKDVRQGLQRMGVSPEEAKARVDALSEEEAERLAGYIDQAPAGEGVVGAFIGAVIIIFFVLLFTDIIGLTDVFTFVKS